MLSQLTSLLGLAPTTQNSDVRIKAENTEGFSEIFSQYDGDTRNARAEQEPPVPQAEPDEGADKAEAESAAAHASAPDDDDRITREIGEGLAKAAELHAEPANADARTLEDPEGSAAETARRDTIAVGTASDATAETDIPGGEPLIPRFSGQPEAAMQAPRRSFASVSPTSRSGSALSLAGIADAKSAMVARAAQGSTRITRQTGIQDVIPAQAAGGVADVADEVAAVMTRSSNATSAILAPKGNDLTPAQAPLEKPLSGALGSMTSARTDTKAPATDTLAQPQTSPVQGQVRRVFSRPMQSLSRGADSPAPVTAEVNASSDQRSRISSPQMPGLAIHGKKAPPAPQRSESPGSIPATRSASNRQAEVASPANLSQDPVEAAAVDSRAKAVTSEKSARIDLSTVTTAKTVDVPTRRGARMEPPIFQAASLKPPKAVSPMRARTTAVRTAPLAKVAMSQPAENIQKSEANAASVEVINVPAANAMRAVATFRRSTPTQAIPSQVAARMTSGMPRDGLATSPMAAPSAAAPVAAGSPIHVEADPTTISRSSIAPAESPKPAEHSLKDLAFDVLARQPNQRSGLSTAPTTPDADKTSGKSGYAPTTMKAPLVSASATAEFRETPQTAGELTVEQVKTAGAEGRLANSIRENQRQTVAMQRKDPDTQGAASTQPDKVKAASTERSTNPGTELSAQAEPALNVFSPRGGIADRKVVPNRSGRGDVPVAGRMSLGRSSGDTRTVARVAPTASSQKSMQLTPESGLVTSPLLADAPEEAAEPQESDLPFFGTELRASRGSGPVPSGLAAQRMDPGNVMRQVADGLQRLSEGRVEVQLNPEELGRVRMQFVAAEHGMTVHIQTDRPETLELMRRNIDQLARDLADAGHGNAEFRFGGDGQTNNRDGNSGSGNHPANATPDAANEPAPTATMTPRQVEMTDGLDITV